jgi:hypothetical protein
MTATCDFIVHEKWSCKQQPDVLLGVVGIRASISIDGCYSASMLIG